MPRRGDYLFKRKGSQNWWLRLQYSGRAVEIMGTKKVETSLQTPDRQEAEIRAFDQIKAHKLTLLILRNQREQTIQTNKEPYALGEHRTHDGERFIATENGLIFLAEDGSYIRTEPNNSRLELRLEIAPDEQRALRPFIKAKASADDSIIDTWLAQRGINKHLAMEATSAWSLFKDLVKNKPLKHCTRNDGRMLVKALLDSGNKTQTVAKKVGHLRAAVNLAIDDGKLLFNPFRNVTPPITDELVRIPLSREDMVLVNAHVHELRLSDQLLWKWLASTGMRLEEPFQVREEFEEDGIRYIVIGTKTDQSKRRVPLPDCVMAMLPDRIMGPVFQDSAETAAKRIRYFLRRLGISHDRRKGTGDPRKVIHSLRHRAADRLRAVRCPLEIQHQILGHEVKTVASGYGHGHPVATLKEWIDKISY